MENTYLTLDGLINSPADLIEEQKQRVLAGAVKATEYGLTAALFIPMLALYLGSKAIGYEPRNYYPMEGEFININDA